jgi:hypothetical protein
VPSIRSTCTLCREPYFSISQRILLTRNCSLIIPPCAYIIKVTSYGASRFLMLVLELQRLGVTVVGVYRQIYRHCTEHRERMAPADRAACVRAGETVHIYSGTRHGGRARVEWTHIFIVYYRGSIPGRSRPFYLLHQRCSPSFLSSE